MLYLVQNRRLRNGRIGGWYRRLPDIERLERYNKHSVTGGFVLLTVGILIGAAMLHWLSESLGLSWFDPRILATIGVWLICAALVTLARLPRYRGRPVALLTLVALVLAVALPVAAGLLWPTWHAFFGGSAGG